MKFRVDDMPSLPCECPFFVLGEHTCKLDEQHCDYFRDEEHHVNNPLDCRYLIDSGTEYFLQHQRDSKYY